MAIGLLLVIAFFDLSHIRCICDHILCQIVVLCSSRMVVKVTSARKYR